MEKSKGFGNRHTQVLIYRLLFSRSVMSDSLWPQELQHTRLPCPSPSLELAKTHVHWIGDAIQPSHPLSSLCPPAFNLSQNQDLFQWVSFSHQVAKVLELQLHHQSFQWIFRVDFLYDWLIWFPCCTRDSQQSSTAPGFESIILRCSTYFMVHFHICTWLLEKP